MRTMSVRQRILAYLGNHRAASAAQIGRALNVSSASIRHHLRILRSDNRVSTFGETRGDRRGRPMRLYRLSDRTLGDNLQLVADSLLTRWPAYTSSPQRISMAAGLSRDLSRQVGIMDPQMPAPRRLASLIEKLNALHYWAKWEAGV